MTDYYHIRMIDEANNVVWLDGGFLLILGRLPSCYLSAFYSNHWAQEPEPSPSPTGLNI